MRGQNVLARRPAAVDLDLFEDVPRPAPLEDLGAAVNEVTERLGEHSAALSSLQRRREELKTGAPALRRKSSRAWPEMEPPLRILGLRRVHTRR